MQARIRLNKMDFYSYHGFYDHEREKGNHFEVDFSFVTDVSAAVHQDAIDGTVNYEEIYQLIREEMEIPSKLLEHVAGRILSRIKAEIIRIDAAEITIAKLEPPIHGDIESVSVTMGF